MERHKYVWKTSAMTEILRMKVVSILNPSNAKASFVQNQAAKIFKTHYNVILVFIG